jgi:hypothetical protein
MTEAKWLTSTNLKSLTDYLVRDNITSERKFRLFVVACCRLIDHHLNHQTLREALDAAERMGEGLIKEGTLARYRRQAYDAHTEATQAGNKVGACAALSIFSVSERPRYASTYLRETPHRVAESLALEAGLAPDTPEFKALFTQRLEGMIALLRDVVGNPFRQLPPRDPAWLEAHAGLAGRLASSIYEERRFSELPILADALEDAGCTEATLLEHFRGPGPHDRGCWALDVILGKG